MTIRVVNKKTHDGPGEYIGRPSILGNPFSHLSHVKGVTQVATRDEAVSRYESWLREQYRIRPDIRDELERLARLYITHGALTLICWCSPQACHGDVLARAIVGVAERIKEQP
jgi:hypothetical protein